MHKRAEIRAALSSLLVGSAPTYGTAAQDRVYSNRPHNVPNSKCPAIIIRDGDEAPVPRDMRSTIYQRTWSVRLEVLVESSTDYVAQLDQITGQIETLISSNRSLNGTCSSSLYVGTTEPEIDASGEKPVGKITITFEIKYLT